MTSAMHAFPDLGVPACAVGAGAAAGEAAMGAAAGGAAAGGANRSALLPPRRLPRCCAGCPDKDIGTCDSEPHVRCLRHTHTGLRLTAVAAAADCRRPTADPCLRCRSRPSSQARDWLRCIMHAIICCAPKQYAAIQVLFGVCAELCRTLTRCCRQQLISGRQISTLHLYHQHTRLGIRR